MDTELVPERSDGGKTPHSTNAEKRISRADGAAMAIGIKKVKSGKLRTTSSADQGSHGSDKHYFDLKSDLTSLKKLVLGSYVNLLLFVVPFGAISHFLDWNPTLVFFLNFFGMMPLASILGDSTECLAEHLGETIGGLLNATFGNAVEIVVMILALVKAKSFKDADQRATLINVVQFSLIGSIFSNSLLVLGCAFLAPGFKKDSHFNVQTTSANVSLLMLASFVMILPAPYTGSSELEVSRAAAILLLIMYSCLLVFVLFTHKDLGEETEPIGAIMLHETHAHGKKHEHDHEYDHDLEHDHDHDHDHEHEHGHEHEHEKDGKEEEEEELEMSLFGSMGLLLTTTIIVAVLSEFLVSAIEPMSNSAGIGEAFVGMILLPIIGNAVEHITAIRMARKGKMDIALSIAIGSATQVAMFVVGLAVIVGWILNIPMTLDFPEFEVQMFIYTSIIIFALISDGSSNWLEGAMLLCLYIMIAVAVWHQEV